MGRNRDKIRSDVLSEVVPVTSLMSATDRAVRDRKADRANRLIDSFFAAMDGRDPIESEEDAIQRLAPIAIWFIGWAARQFAIMVLRALWRRWNDTVLVTTTA